MLIVHIVAVVKWFLSYIATVRLDRLLTVAQGTEDVQSVRAGCLLMTSYMQLRPPLRGRP